MAVLKDEEIFRKYGCFQVLFPEKGGQEFYAPLEVAEFLNQTVAWLFRTSRRMQEKFCVLPSSMFIPDEHNIDIYDENIPFVQALKVFVSYYRFHYLDVQVLYEEHLKELRQKLPEEIEERQAQEAQERREAELENELAKTEYFLDLAKEENEKLRVKITELENAAQNSVGNEERPNLQWEVDKLRMLLEDEEKKSFGLAQELETRIFELGLARQELEDLKKQSGEAFRIRPMWRYVLELEEQGKPVDVIREALHGDGFSYPTANALLYDGEAATFEAVKKWGQRNFPKE